MNEFVFEQVIKEKIASLGNQENLSKTPLPLKISGNRLPTVGERARNSIRKRRKLVWRGGSISGVSGPRLGI